MAKQRQRFGSWGERVAALFLESKGYQIVARNERTEYGEIDLIAKQDDALVFVEVKTRSSAEYGNPEESVTLAKQQHLQDAATAYLQAHPELDGDWRVDVIAVQRVKGQSPEILHFENALEG